MPRRKQKSRRKELLFVVAVIVVASVGFSAYFLAQGGQMQQGTGTVPEGVSTETSDEVRTLPDGTKYIINPNKLLSGGPPQGGIGEDRGIPALVDPEFVSTNEADRFLDGNDIVFGLVVNGEAKAYTKEVLVFHEIANDVVGGEPVLATYCPLCGTAIAFDPVMDGDRVLFGTSGKLYKSNLVMYDQRTESYWTQVGGRAVVGPLTGAKLDQVSIDTMTYSDWKRLHPDTKVMSRDTGFIRPYGTDPYGSYYTSDRTSFGADFDDTRLHPKDMVSGIEVDGEVKAYPVKEIDKVNVLNDEFNGVPLLVTMDPTIEIRPEVNPVQVYDRRVNGKALEFEIRDGKLVDVGTGSEWEFTTGKAVSGEMKGEQLDRVIRASDMWFNWVAFHPDTELFKAG